MVIFYYTSVLRFLSTHKSYAEVPTLRDMMLSKFCGFTSRSGNKIFPYDPYKLGKNQYDQRTHHTLEYLASNLGEAIQTLHLIKRVLVSFVAFTEKTCGHGACPSCPGGDYKFYCSKPFNDIY